MLKRLCKLSFPLSLSLFLSLIFFFSLSSFIPCSRIILQVDSKYLEAIRAFPIFRSYLHESFLDSGLQEGLEVETTLKGQILTLKILSLINLEEKREKNSSLFYMITKETVFDIVSNDINEENSPSVSSSVSSSVSPSVPVSSSLSSSSASNNFNQLFQLDSKELNNFLLSKIQTSFCGYTNQINTMLGLINLGMGLIQLNPANISSEEKKMRGGEGKEMTSLFRLPRGILIHGPSGCGKSELVEAVVRAYGIHSIYISHQILLAR